MGRGSAGGSTVGRVKAIDTPFVVSPWEPLGRVLPSAGVTPVAASGVPRAIELSETRVISVRGNASEEASAEFVEPDAATRELAAVWKKQTDGAR